MEYCCRELLKLGCEAFGFNLLGKEEWLGWLIRQQDIGWLNQGEEAGRAFGNGMMDFALCICLSKEIPNCSEVQEILLFSIVTGSYNLELTIHGKTQQNVLISWYYHR